MAILTYANTLGHGFVWDDPIVLDQKVRFYRGPLDAWFEPPGLPNMRMYRPLEMMSFWLDQAMWWRNGFGFHLTQVLFHALNAALLVTLLLALGVQVWPAVIATTLFVVHPVQVEAVAWLICRADILTGTFSLLALLAFLRYQERPAWPLLAGIALAAFLCTASKESGVVVPVLVAAAAWSVGDQARSSRARLQAAAPAIAAATIGVLACTMLRPADVTTGIDLSTFGVHTLANLIGSFGYHVARVLAPLDFAPYVPRAPTDAVHLAVAGIGAMALVALIMAPAREGSLRRLGAMWFLIAVAPAVAVVLADFTTTVVAERRLYFPMIGVAILTASALTANARLWQRRTGAIVIGVVLVGLTAVSILRNRHWRDDLTLWSAVTERLDNEALPYVNLGLTYASQKRLAEAESAYRSGLALNSTPETRQRLAMNLGLVLMERGILDEAHTLFTSANAIAPHYLAHRGLGVVAYLRAQAAQRAGDPNNAQAKLAEARRALEQALLLNPRYYQAHYSLAGVLQESGHYREALSHYQYVVDHAGDTDAGRNAVAAIANLSAWLAANPGAP